MKKIVFIALVCHSIVLHSQNCIQQYQDNDFGLQSYESEITGLYADSSNHKWFAFENSFGGYGLGKYDDADWVEFNSSNSDLGGKVNDIAFLRDSIYLATENGLYIFDGSATSGWVHFSSSNSNLPADRITAIASGMDGKVWLGFHNGNIGLFDKTTAQIALIENVTSKPVNVLKHHENTLWAGLNNKPGLAKYENQQWQSFDQTTDVTSLAIDSNKQVWASYYGGILEWTSEGGLTEHNPMPDTSLYHLAVDTLNQVWVLSNKGLLKFHNGEFILFNHENSALPVNLSKPLSVDGNNKLWFGYQVTENSSTNMAAGYFQKSSPLGVSIQSNNGFSICRHDSAILRVDDSYSKYLWSTGANMDSIIARDSGMVHVAVVDDNHCADYDTVTLNVQKPYENEDIALITTEVVDNTTQYNLVIWERTANKGTDYYNIYKQGSVQGEFNKIGEVPFNQFSVFVDSNSRAGTESEKYKISTVDTCGNESELSDWHKTMNLTVSLGIENKFNLIWEHYIGLDFGTYKVYRGTSPDNLTLLDEIAKGTEDLQTYVDDPPAGTYYYQVRIDLPRAINPTTLKTTANYSQAHSNMEKKLKVSGPDNAAPTAIQLSNDSIDENKPVHAVIGKLTAQDPDEGDVHSFSLVQGTGDTDNSHFFIENDSLRSNVSFNYEEKSMYSIRVRVKDDKEAFRDSIMTIVISDVNESPHNIQLSKDKVSENTAIGTSVGLLTAEDPDQGQEHTFLLPQDSADNHYFSIGDDYLQVHKSLDYEVDSVLEIYVKVSDNGNPVLSDAKKFVIQINDVLEMEGISTKISTNSVHENMPVNTEVGKLITSDPNSNNSYEYAFASGSGDDHNTLFTIENDSIKTNAVFNFEERNTFSIRVKTIINDTAEIENEFTLFALDTNEAPYDIVISKDRVLENQPAGTIVGSLTVLDEDKMDQHQIAIDFPVENGSISFTIENDLLKTTSELDYEQDSTYILHLVATDNGTPPQQFAKDITIHVIDMDEVGIANNTRNQVRIYPNPVKDKLYLQLKNQQHVSTIIIYDINGNQVVSFRTNQSFEVINTDNLTKGLYMISIDGNGVMKFVKE